MLVIVTGIHNHPNKRMIARQLYVVLNGFDKFSYQGYTFDYTSYQFYTITDSNGQLAYQAHTTNAINFAGRQGTTSTVEVNIEVGNYAEQLLAEIEQTISDNDYFTPDVESDQKVQTLINNYNNSKEQFVVVHGNFGTAVIDSIKSSIGNDNVMILNVLRHPVISWLLDDSHNRRSVEPLNGIEISSAIFRSCINANVLLKDSAVTSVKFEDILNNKSFEFNGKTIQCPDIDPLNNYLLKEEGKFLETLTEKDITDYGTLSQMCSNLTSYGPIEDPNFPNDIYTTFNYTPVDYTTISQAK